eukprot:5233498-Pleurochrysis_carterae.AAC.1
MTLKLSCCRRSQWHDVLSDRALHHPRSRAAEKHLHAPALQELVTAHTLPRSAFKTEGSTYASVGCGSAA